MLQTAITDDDSERIENTKDVTPDEPLISIEEPKEAETDNPVDSNGEIIIDELFPVGQA